jgi:uncharacterized repeat protein (TIGR03803 family)
MCAHHGGVYNAGKSEILSKHLTLGQSFKITAAKCGEETNMNKLSLVTKACVIFLLCAAAAIALAAQTTPAAPPTTTFTTLYNFCAQSGCTDGANPAAGLIQGANGTFYGTTYEGGADNDGTVFSITPGGTLTRLHSFDLADGFSPGAGLMQGTNGQFYGTTARGG